MAVPFVTGFNDVWNGYAASAEADLAFDRAAGCSSKVVRFNLFWDVIERAPGQYTWTDVGRGYDYANLRYQANRRGLKVLPIVIGCPGWVPNRKECKPGGGTFYAVGDSVQHYANFVVTACKYFDECQRIDAVEIWNEPNLGWGNTDPTQIGPARINDPAEYNALLAASLCAMANANGNGQFSHPLTVVSAGLYMDYGAGTWKSYLAAFENQSIPYGVGIHPYDTRKLESHAWDVAADMVVARIAELYDQAKNLTGRDLWVTETGCSSRRPPFDQEGQNRALRKLAGVGGEFANRARCKAVVLHRLYPMNQSCTDGCEDGATGLFFKYSLTQYDSAWTPKQAYNTLASHWA